MSFCQPLLKRKSFSFNFNYAMTGEKARLTQF